MRRRKSRHQLGGIIEIIALGIQVGIADPVIEILERLLVAPEQLYTLRISTPGIVECGIEIVDRHRLDEVFIFLVIGFYPEYLVLGHLLVVDDIMGRLRKSYIGGIEQLAVLRLLVEYP